MRRALIAAGIAQARGGRRRQVVEPRKRRFLADELRSGQALKRDRLVAEQGLIAQNLDHADEAVRFAAVETDGRENGLEFDHAGIGARADGRKADGSSHLESLAKERDERDARLRVPVRQEASAPELEAEAFAQTGAGEAVDRPRR